MRRSSLGALGLQAGLLAGVGLALVGGAEPPDARANAWCVSEGQCTYAKPIMLLLVDYSTAMNAAYMPGKTRWQAAVEAIVEVIDGNNGLAQGEMILGLMRFGHDASPGLAGTTILGDVSNPPIVDGVALDVGLYDPDKPGKPYFECNGEALKAAITGQKPPMDGAAKGIGAWTKGALGRAAAYIAQMAADHPDDKPERLAVVLVLTQGQWTDASGTLTMKPPADDPAPVAAEISAQQDLPTAVVSFGDADGKAAADALAAAGGSGQAMEGAETWMLHSLIEQYLFVAKEKWAAPICTPAHPRVMVLLDASSGMLNVAGGTVAGAQGETGWDRARELLAGETSIVDHAIFGHRLERLVYLGLAVFGDAAPVPGEQKVLVDYAACGEANVAWATDPLSSCAAPGCDDPWGGPPISWTFNNGGEVDPPGFDEPTLSHMPRCEAGGPFPLACNGSGGQLHLGLELVQSHIAAYKAKCMAGFSQPCSPETVFLNLLVTDGNDESGDAAVQAALEQMFADGVRTYVIGVGDAVDPVRLQQLAGWGSGGSEGFFAAADQQALQLELQAIVEEIPFDPCCYFKVCGPADVPAVCGNGVVEGGEECDDGNLVDGDGCDASCSLDGVTSDGCGNGIVEGSEECDDGNATPGDGCEPECTLTPEGGSSGTTDGEPASTTTDGPETGGVVPTTGDAPGTGGETAGEGSTGGDAAGEGSTGGASVEDGGCGCAAEGGRAGLGWVLVFGAMRRRGRRQGGSR